MENIVLNEFKRIFREADFQGFIKIGAPLDEYDNEALYLYKNISSKDTIEEIQKKIWEHFYNSFCTGTSYSEDGKYKKYSMSIKKAKEYIGTVDAYKEVAEKLKEAINNYSA